MRGRRVFRCMVVIGLLALAVPEGVKAERSMSRSALEKELKHLRESLHEAHRELGIKADRIAELEASLENASAKSTRLAGGERGACKASERKKREMSRKATVAPVSPRERREPINGGDSPDPIEERIYFERNSAVNYDGREKVLRFVREELAQHPGTRFTVMATANDSAYDEADRDIASNRARFLVDYLKIRGVPGEAFSEVAFESSEAEGKRGRMLLIRAARTP